MICLVVGAIINLILDPIFIFVFKQGVAGGAIATIIGQFVSFIIAILYIPKIKSVKLEKQDFKIDKDIFKTLSLGLSSFITQMTVLALFVVMNNLMTKYGASSKYGSDIPLSVYGVISKVNNFYVSSILGIAIGSQPIIGFNYGAGKYERVKETLRKVLLTGLIVGIIFNLALYLFPSEIASIFIAKNDPTYDLFMEFAIKFCRIFFIVCFLNFFEMTTSTTIQSLGNFKKATLVSFTRQIILFIPLALILSHIYGLDGALYAGPLADSICFIFVIFVFGSEYKKLSKLENKQVYQDEVITSKPILNEKVIVTISREYGSGGRYVGKLLAEELGIPFYDKNLIHLTSKESGLSEHYIEENEQTKNAKYFYNNDDTIYIAESKVIKKIAKDSCVIIGRCADDILSNEKNIYKVFLYSDENSKIKRAVKYYGLKKENALKEINKINKRRAKHYKYYTNKDWNDFNNYDLVVNVDTFGVEKTANLIKNAILERKDI
jgi:cytidylate kinase